MRRGTRYEPHLHAEALGLRVEYGRLRHGRKGEYRHASGLVIILAGMSRRQERCTLAHEVQHALAGDVRSRFGPLNSRMESRADRRAAALLICPQEYRTAEELHGSHAGAIADELDVTLHMLEVWQRLTAHRMAA